MKKVFFIILSVLLLASCEEVKRSLTDSEYVEGLKEALKVGTVNAAKELGKENGYLNSDVKINLPAEAQTALNTIKAMQTIAENDVISTIFQVAGYTMPADLDQKLIAAINEAAGQAAPKSVNIFKKAITNMTFEDGKSILFSSNNQAATDYLQKTTCLELRNAFNPVIDKSLQTVKIGSSVPALWTKFAEQNNKLVEVINSEYIQRAIVIAVEALNMLTPEEAATINSMKNINSDLGNYVTEKALDGLFTKVGSEEAEIRTNAEARVNSLLKRVFGQLDKAGS